VSCIAELSLRSTGGTRYGGTQSFIEPVLRSDFRVAADDVNAPRAASACVVGHACAVRRIDNRA